EITPAHLTIPVRLRATSVREGYQINATMSALGQKRTCAVHAPVSAGPIADMCSAAHVAALGQKRRGPRSVPFSIAPILDQRTKRLLGRACPSFSASVSIAPYAHDP